MSKTKYRSARSLPRPLGHSWALSSAQVALVLLVLLASRAFAQAPGSSLGVIPFDPNAYGEATARYVSGNSGTVTGPFVGTNINTTVGAATFYANGYTGTNVAIANIEAGNVWSGHESLSTTLQITPHSNSINEVDRHATWVGMILAGRPAGNNPGDYQQGMAPGAQLYSGAIASQWNGSRFSLNFNYFFSTMFDQYRHAFSTGMDANGRRADVINSSYGGGDTTGTGTPAVALDGFANANPRTLLVVSAGNSGPGPNQVFSPASGYNNIAVAALGPDSAYNTPASFSSGGPNNYSDPVNGTFANARQAVDIAAPGQQQSSAYYGGTTGGNGTTDNPSVTGTGPTGGASGIAGGADYYSRGIAGTSFAAPTVAGGAALLDDVAYSQFAANADARDGRVIKAVLMNTADKTVGWDNGQIPHPNGFGGVQTAQGLDDRVGTGAMNLDHAYHEYLDGTTDVPGLGAGNLGLVHPLGWDYGQVTSALTNDYFFDTPLLGGSMFSGTLTWFRDRSVSANNTVSDQSFDDLDLELWSVLGGVPNHLISESFSAFNASEHFYFSLPATGNYALRVRWAGEIFDLIGDADQEQYGLAWTAVAVPEPSSVVLALVGAAALVLVARRRKRSR